jgi:valyl-tRNA synthetase
LYYTDVPFLAENAALISRLARLNAVTEVRDGTGVYLTDTKYRAWLDIDPATARGYVEQLATKQTAQKAVISQLEGRLSNKQYVHNAPKHIVEQTRQQLEEAREQLEKLEHESERFAAK